MTAISPVSSGGSAATLRNATAQANTGQTDYVFVPTWARAAVVYLNLKAVAGTTPLLDFKLIEADPLAKDTDHVTDLEGWDGITQVSAADLITVRVGPHRTAVDDIGPDYHVATILPVLMGFRVTLDRTTGDETYTYTLSVHWAR